MLGAGWFEFKSHQMRMPFAYAGEPGLVLITHGFVKKKDKAPKQKGNMKTRHEILMEDPEYRRLYAIEGLVADAAELVARLMEEQGVNKAELARRLGKSRAWVTQLLSGKANMTIRTFAEVVHALGAQVALSARAEANPKGNGASRRGTARRDQPRRVAVPQPAERPSAG